MRFPYFFTEIHIREKYQNVFAVFVVLCLFLIIVLIRHIRHVIRERKKQKEEEKLKMIYSSVNKASFSNLTKLTTRADNDKFRRNRVNRSSFINKRGSFTKLVEAYRAKEESRKRVRRASSGEELLGPKKLRTIFKVSEV